MAILKWGVSRAPLRAYTISFVFLVCSTLLSSIPLYNPHTHLQTYHAWLIACYMLTVRAASHYSAADKHLTQTMHLLLCSVLPYSTPQSCFLCFFHTCINYIRPRSAGVCSSLRLLYFPFIVPCYNILPLVITERLASSLRTLPMV